MGDVMNEITILPLQALHTADFELTDFFAQRQVWINGYLFKRETPRPVSGLLYLNGCTGTYTDLISGKSFFAPCKSLVYLPYGSRYSVLNMDSKIHKPDAYLVEFNILYNAERVALSPMPCIIPINNTYTIEKAMREAVDCYESVPVSPALLKAKTFDILARISRNEISEKDKIYKKISPALTYMDEAPFDSLSVEDYAAMCGLSSGGFRRLFKQYIGKSPIAYIIDNKLASAKMLLEESDISIKEISEILHFESNAYFHRVFKQHTLLTPSEYRNKKRN